MDYELRTLYYKLYIENIFSWMVLIINLQKVKSIWILKYVENSKLKYLANNGKRTKALIGRVFGKFLGNDDPVTFGVPYTYFLISM